MRNNLRGTIGLIGKTRRMVGKPKRKAGRVKKRIFPSKNCFRTKAEISI
jgi:hypothetical protein